MIDRGFRAFGTTFTVRASDELALHALEERSRWLGWEPAAHGSGDRTYSIRLSTAGESAAAPAFDLDFNDTPVRRGLSLDLTADAFENHAKVQTAFHAEGLLFVHAGAVSVRGHGVIVPGMSRSGKSTLVSALLDAGATYYSDEFALIDRDGRLHPYPLPLTLRSGEDAPPHRSRPANTASASPESIVPVDVIIVTSYLAEAEWSPRTLSPADAVLALMSHTVAAEAPPARTMPVLREAALRARTLEGPRGDARIVAESIVASLM